MYLFTAMDVGGLWQIYSKMHSHEEPTRLVTVLV